MVSGRRALTCIQVQSRTSRQLQDTVGPEGGGVHRRENTWLLGGNGKDHELPFPTN